MFIAYKIKKYNIFNTKLDNNEVNNNIEAIILFCKKMWISTISCQGRKGFFDLSPEMLALNWKLEFIYL